MSQPTYRIAQALHASRAAVGLKKYGQHLTADTPGCMIVHAIKEAADLTEYLLAEAQRRKIVLETLNELSKEMHAELAIGWAYRIEKLYDLLGGKSAIEKYDEILGGGTVAENATVAPDPRDEALRVAAGKIHHWHDWGDNNEGMVVSSAAVRELWGALAATPAQSLAAHDAEVKVAVLREVAKKWSGIGPSNASVLLEDEADRIAKEAPNG